MIDKEFLDEFVLDSGELLAVLSESLLKLEKNPADPDSINRFFRAAHTLKGNSATLGLMEISGLSHKMETVFDGVRRGRLTLTGEVVDLLFEALDALESMVGSASKGAPLIDCRQVLSRLESVTPAEDDEECESGKARPEPDPAPLKKFSKTYRVDVEISESATLKSVRAFMILNNLKSLGAVLRGEPDLGSIEKGDFEKKFTLYLGSDTPLERVEAAISKVGDVTDYTVAEEKPDECTLPDPVTSEVKSIRVGTNKLDDLVNLMGELVINKSRLSQIAKDYEIKSLHKAVKSFDRLSQDLQTLAMSMRTVKVSHIFDKFPRMVRDLAKKEGKKVEFIVEGRDIEMDRTVLDRLGDPLVHLLRNCVDHGIETPDVREALGKPAKGIIRLSASRVKEHVEIRLRDDGAGIDPGVLSKKAVEKGFLTSAEAGAMDSEDLIELIFRPGFSGAAEVTDVSGRGVGMDVVKTAVSKLGGSVQVSSKPGEGTEFTLRLPLSLAIVKALLVQSSGEIYAIPTKDVSEVLSLKKLKLKKIKGREAVVHRGMPMQVLKLDSMLGPPGKKSRNYTKFIVYESPKIRLGIAVEKIIRQDEIVMKGLGSGLDGVPGVSGATILGNGQVALVLDLSNLKMR